MMSPEEREIALQAEQIFKKHLMVPKKDHIGPFCFECMQPWPCEQILLAREMTSNLAEEVD
jgi:hypothetical protein